MTNVLCICTADVARQQDLDVGGGYTEGRGALLRPYVTSGMKCA